MVIYVYEKKNIINVIDDESANDFIQKLKDLRFKK